MEPVKIPNRAVTGPGMMGLGRAQAQGSPPGVKSSVNMRVKRRTQRVAWKVIIGDCMSSGKNKSVKSGDIFGERKESVGEMKSLLCWN